MLLASGLVWNSTVKDMKFDRNACLSGKNIGNKSRGKQ